MEAGSGKEKTNLGYHDKTLYTKINLGQPGARACAFKRMRMTQVRTCVEEEDELSS
jgi:hypothetical protein